MIFSPKHTPQLGISLVELLITLAILAVITSMSLPTVSRIFESSTDAKARMNARNLESMSADLAALGVAHVIPDSLGGIEATARLIRTGVIVPEGPMSGALFRMAALSDEDIAEMAKYLSVVYHKYELSIQYIDGSVTVEWQLQIPDNLVSLGKSRRELTNLA